MNPPSSSRIAVVVATIVQLAMAPTRGWSQEATRAVEAPPGYATVDTRLDEQKRLHISMRNANGAPCRGRPLEIHPLRGEALAATTDDRGDAIVPLERGGVYLITSGDDAQLCRVWTREGAPPTAQEGVLLVENSALLRGHHKTGNDIYDFFERRPVIAYSLAAAAIVLPIVLLTQDDKDASN